MKRTEKFIKERNKKIAKTIQQAIMMFDIEEEVRDFVRERLFKKYDPSKEELRATIREHVIETAKTVDVLRATVEQLVEEKVEERITAMEDDIRMRVRNAVQGALDDFDY